MSNACTQQFHFHVSFLHFNIYSATVNHKFSVLVFKHFDEKERKLFVVRKPKKSEYDVNLYLQADFKAFVSFDFYLMILTFVVIAFFHEFTFLTSFIS